MNIINLFKSRGDALHKEAEILLKKAPVDTYVVHQDDGGRECLSWRTKKGVKHADINHGNTYEVVVHKKKYSAENVTQLLYTLENPAAGTDTKPLVRHPQQMPPLPQEIWEAILSHSAQARGRLAQTSKTQAKMVRESYPQKAAQFAYNQWRAHVKALAEYIADLSKTRGKNSSSRISLLTLVYSTFTRTTTQAGRQEAEQRAAHIALRGLDNFFPTTDMETLELLVQYKLVGWDTVAAQTRNISMCQDKASGALFLAAHLQTADQSAPKLQEIFLEHDVRTLERCWDNLRANNFSDAAKEEVRQVLLQK